MAADSMSTLARPPVPLAQQQTTAALTGPLNAATQRQADSATLQSVTTRLSACLEDLAKLSQAQADAHECALTQVHHDHDRAIDILKM